MRRVRAAGGEVAQDLVWLRFPRPYHSEPSVAETGLGTVYCEGTKATLLVGGERATGGWVTWAGSKVGYAKVSSRKLYQYKGAVDVLRPKLPTLSRGIWTCLVS